MSGVPITINSLPGVPVDGVDKFPVWDTSTGITGAYSWSQIVTELSVVYAQLGAANTFTANQTLAKVDPTLTLTPTSGKGAMAIASADAGASWGGNISLGRNTNATTAAAGFAGFIGRSGVANYVWVDASANVRINNALPTSANDTAGTVVGTQTSTLDTKDVIEGAQATIEEVLAWVAEGADAVRAWKYKGQQLLNEDGELVEVPGQYPDETFEGVIVDYAPRYGMDRDEAHPAGKSLNTITIIGDLLRAVDALAGRVAALESAAGA